MVFSCWRCWPHLIDAPMSMVGGRELGVLRRETSADPAQCQHPRTIGVSDTTLYCASSVRSQDEASLIHTIAIFR